MLAYALMADQLLPNGGASYLTSTLTVLWYICWPIAVLIYYLAIAVLSIIKLLYQPVGFLLQPLVIVGHFILACLIAPFRLLSKFEVGGAQIIILTTTDQFTRHSTFTSASQL